MSMNKSNVLSKNFSDNEYETIIKDKNISSESSITNNTSTLSNSKPSQLSTSESENLGEQDLGENEEYENEEYNISSKSEVKQKLEILPTPPPIKKVIKNIKEVPSYIPGIVKQSKSGELLKTFFRYEGFAGFVLKIYNNWVDFILPDRIGATKITYVYKDKELIVSFGNVQMNKPLLKGKPLLPIQALNKGISYSGELRCDIFVNGELMIENVFLGRIPIMKGSSKCYLANLTPKELVKFGECLSDPLGYFIINGTERVVVIQEKLRTNKIFLFLEKDMGPIAKMTCKTITGTTVVTLFRDTNKIIKANMYFLDRNSSGKYNGISVFKIFRILCPELFGNGETKNGLDGFTNLENFLKNFIKPKPKIYRRIMSELRTTLKDFEENIDDFSSIETIKIKSEIRRPRRRRRGARQEIQKERGFTLQDKMNLVPKCLREQLFPQMDKNDVIGKLSLLAKMLIHYVEHFSGSRNLTDRDNWSNKRLETAGRSMEQLFNNIWENVVGGIETELNTYSVPSKNSKQSLANRVFKSIKSTMITNDFEKSFNPDRWGASGSYKKENITEIIKREAPLSIYSSINKINTPTSRESKVFAVRMVHPSQKGYVDATETPEGKNCGLVGHLALTCQPSIDRSMSDRIILERIVSGKYLSPPLKKDLNHPDSCIMNGKFLGWCSAVELRRFLLKLRRSMDTLPVDTAIVHVPKDRSLYIYTDGSRPTRPLLIVDEKTNRLVIDIKNKWGANFDELLSTGCVEYVDSWEEEMNLYVAFKPEKVKTTLNEIENLENNKKFVEQKIYNYKQQLIREKEEEEEVSLYIPGLVESSTTEDLLKDAELELSEIVNSLNNLVESPYTHSELNPTAILGYAASLVPLAQHNQAPRNVYQCEPVTTPVLCPNKFTKMGDLKNGNTVITIDPLTLKASETKIKNHFTVDSRLASKTLLEITTINGRKIQATHDHGFLTQSGWIDAGKLNIAKDYVAIFPNVDILSDEREDSLIIGVEEAKEKLISLGVKNSIIIKHVQELVNMKLLPLNTNYQHLPIIARILGYTQADGHISLSNPDKNVRIRMTFGQKYDGELFNQDISKLGFSPNKIQESHDIYKHENGKVTIHHVWVIDKKGSFASLIAILDSVLGRKTIAPNNPIPNWIINGSDLIKREYIAGFMGGDGCKINTSVRKYETKIGAAFNMSRLVQYKHKKYQDSMHKWFSSFIELLNYFDIKVNKLEMFDTYYDRVRFELSICSSKDTLIRYMDKIGYRYATTKSTYSLKVVEWLKYTNYELERVRNLKKQVHDLHYNKKYTHKRLAKLFNISIYQSQHYCKNYRSNGATELPDKSIKLEEWLKLVIAKNNCIFLPILSINKVEGCLVGDFTTEASTHSFVSGDGFITHNCSMAKQAIGIAHSNHMSRMDLDIKTLAYPTRPLFANQMNDLLGFGEVPTGQTVTVAIAPWKGFNQEDAIIFNKSSIQRGLFRYILYRTFKTVENKNHDRGIEEIVKRPEKISKSQEFRFRHIRKDGLPELGSELMPGDVVISKVRCIKKTIISEGHPKTIIEEVNASVEIGIGEGGRVDSILVTTNSVGSRIIKVKIKEIKEPQVGDKFASRHAQKSTIGLILPQEDLPWSESGIVPDVFINPHCIPSRMTIGKLIEIVASKTAAFDGESIDSTPFQTLRSNTRVGLEDFKRGLLERGFSDKGTEVMYNPYTGEAFESEIFIGPVYYQALRHLVSKKIQVRSQGRVRTLTRQPPGGRSQKGAGGLKFGEMERDAAISFGSTALLKERLCDVSDPFETVFCKSCGMPAISKKTGLSTIKYVCPSGKCGPEAQFGTCTIPYSYKLLSQTLSGAYFKFRPKMKEKEELEIPAKPLIPKIPTRDRERRLKDLEKLKELPLIKTYDEYDDIVNDLEGSGNLNVIFFSKRGCGLCDALDLVFRKIYSKYSEGGFPLKVYKIEYDKNNTDIIDITSEEDIIGYPSTIFYRDGSIIGSVIIGPNILQINNLIKQELDPSEELIKTKQLEIDFITINPKAVKTIPIGERKTSRFLSGYEKARVIGERAKQIAENKPPTVDVGELTEPLDIAEKELKERVIPIVIRRYLKNGEYEDWSVNELILPE